MNARRKTLRRFLRTHRSLLAAALIASASLLGAGWYWGTPTTGDAAKAGAGDGEQILVVRVPEAQRGTIGSWVDFFRCYGLRSDDAVIVWTLRRWIRNVGKPEFSPQKQVEVVLRSRDDASIASTEPFYDDINRIQTRAKQGRCGQGGTE